VALIFTPAAPFLSTSFSIGKLRLYSLRIVVSLKSQLVWVLLQAWKSVVVKPIYNVYKEYCTCCTNGLLPSLLIILLGGSFTTKDLRPRLSLNVMPGAFHGVYTLTLTRISK
jgi:hypothetical protein